ncbi:hypothetical protein [Brunnivagina elsteri]|uniref:hypothetical protein n=1 Tax=Brunnivagina elsteri TaxID=1247191 RepID=UPI0013041F6D|nr:hypothetical protein [Calothrix elsteri]
MLGLEARSHIFSDWIGSAIAWFYVVELEARSHDFMCLDWKCDRMILSAWIGSAIA